MSLALIVFCLAVVLASEPPSDDRNEYTLDEIEQSLETQRRMIRMCGPLSVVRTCALTGQPVDVDATLARYKCQRAQGVSVREIVTLSRDLGLEAKAVRLRSHSLYHLPTPCIILINDDRHCVVLESVAAQTRIAQVWDPADLSTKALDVETLDKRWSGHAIIFDRLPITNSLIDAVNVGAVIVTISLLAWSRRSGRKGNRT